LRKAASSDDNDGQRPAFLMSLSLPSIVAGVEYTLALAGAILLWRVVLSRDARTRSPSTALPPWNAPLTDFLLFLLFVIGGTLFFVAVGSIALKFLPLEGDEIKVFNSAIAQLGMLTGVATFGMQIEHHSLAPRARDSRVFLSGTVTFLISLPVLIATANAWEYFLELCRLPTAKQDLIGMFAQADSPWMLTIMIALAVVIAPLTEECVFRAGLFRYFRTRMPHWVAVLGPALFFATLHVNWTTLQGLSSLAPLTVLAVVFSLAYERTGQIATAIIAHALFNLHTVALIFCGVGV
jgi:membrane protease YdiL (CAAX protease family)